MSRIDVLNQNFSNKVTIGVNDKQFTIKNLDKVTASNGVFSSNRTPWVTKFNRFGNMNPTDTFSANREILIFTKPDLWIYGDDSDSVNYSSALRPGLASIPKFVDYDKRHKDSLAQLQYSMKDKDGYKNPFMYLLSNGVTSKMDLSGITTDSKESTSNVYGTNITYRGSSIKADNGHDFTLSFTDTGYLEIYFLAKAYDEYLKLLKLGEKDLCPKYDHVVNRILPELFSIYKFILSDDGETILYYAKATGVHITDVPRSDFSDPPQDGFKFSLSFHAQFIEDNDPLILADFNSITPAKLTDTFVDVYDLNTNKVNNEWVRFPIIISEKTRFSKGTSTDDYRLKWVK